MPLSRAARAHVPKPERRDGCSVRAAFSGARVMSAGVTPSNLATTQAARPPDLRRAAPASVACWAALRRMCLLSCALRATRPAGIVEQAWPVLRTTLGVLFGHAGTKRSVPLLTLAILTPTLAEQRTLHCGRKFDTQIRARIAQLRFSVRPQPPRPCTTPGTKLDLRATRSRVERRPAQRL